MCRARSTYYYEVEARDHEEEELIWLAADIFKQSRNIYGQRKIKKELDKLGWAVSRLQISRIMRKQDLVFKYTVVQFKSIKTDQNNL